MVIDDKFFLDWFLKATTEDDEIPGSIKEIEGIQITQDSMPMADSMWTIVVQLKAPVNLWNELNIGDVKEISNFYKAEIVEIGTIETSSVLKYMLPLNYNYIASKEEKMAQQVIEDCKWADYIGKFIIIKTKLNNE